MKYINIIYDYEYDDETDTMRIEGDVDIACVPDFVAENLEEIVQEFFDWTNSSDSGCWKKINNKLLCCVDTIDFIKWLNMNYYTYEDKESVIVKQHTKYNSAYPCAEF